MKISIIIPIYNVEQYIEECLNSVYNQNLTEFEVLCIDDRGTDDSILKVKKYIKENNINNLRIIKHSKNKGLSEARNTGIRNAKGEYICFLDSDDILETGGLKKLLFNAIEKKLDIIEGRVNEVFETNCNIELGIDNSERKDSEILNGDDYFADVIKKNTYLPIVVCRLYKRKLFTNNIYFMPGIIFEDEEFSPRIIISANKVQYMNVLLYIYRRRDDSITTNMFNDNKWIESYMKIIDSLKKYSLQIKNKKSYVCLKNRIGQLALSILKNPVAYGANDMQVEKILVEIKNKKIYKIPLSSKSFFIKMQGLLMLYPKLFIYLYGRKKKNEKDKKCNKSY